MVTYEELKKLTKDFERAWKARKPKTGKKKRKGKKW